MTTAELQAFTRVLIDEAAVNNDRVPDALLLDAINRAYVAAALESQCFLRSVSTATVNGTLFYTMPADMFKIRIATFGTITLCQIRERELDAVTPNWRAIAASTPRFIFQHDARQFGLYPAPSTTGPVILEGHVTPISGTAPMIPLLVSANDFPALPLYAHPILAHGAVIEILGGLLLETEAATARVAASTAARTALLERLVAEAGG